MQKPEQHLYPFGSSSGMLPFTSFFSKEFGLRRVVSGSVADHVNKFRLEYKTRLIPVTNQPKVPQIFD